jgi:hypothetical protein
MNEKNKKWFISHEVYSTTNNGVICGFVDYVEQTASIPTSDPNKFIGIDLKFRLNNSGPNIKSLHIFDDEKEALKYYNENFGLE